MKIKIINDSGEVYEKHRIMEASELINDYIDANRGTQDCDDVCDWLETIPEIDALNFIGDMWGIEFKEL